MKVTNDIFNVGVNDREIKIFEGQFVVENGMAYNSYLVIDREIAVFDTVAEGFGDKWIENIISVLGEKEPNYLIVQHMEPDHSYNIDLFMKKFKNAKIVSSKMAFDMMKNFFGTDFEERKVIVKEGNGLTLGKHNLKFIGASMVHWPEVIVTYDEFDKVLFSADGFGKFGATDADEEWDCEARRYYFGIVGKFGLPVQTLLKKASALDIKIICALHGPVLTENLGHYLNLYNIWSSYGVESEGVMIAYTSVYGNTEKAVNLLKAELEDLGCEKVATCNLILEDMAEGVEDAFRYGKLVLATTTYNGEIFPQMRAFIAHLTERNYQNRFISLIENGSWAPMANKVMKGMLENCKNLTFAENSITIKSSVSEENKEKIKLLARELLNK